MLAIDETCKPPEHRMIEKAAKIKPPTPQTRPQTRPQTILKIIRHELFCCDIEEIIKGDNEYRRQRHFTDFVISVGSNEFPVNKIVLAHQSSVFAEMFKGSDSKLEISDSSAEAVEAFLAYLYEQKRPDARNAPEIFKLAAKYGIARLKGICEGIIRESISESNAHEVYQLALGSQKSEGLKIAAFGKIQEMLGGQLDDDLINKPDQLQRIMRTKRLFEGSKKHLDDLITQSRNKNQR